MKIKLKIVAVLLIMLVSFSSTLNAQIADFDEQAIQQDFLYNINLYSQKYIAPVIDGYGLNLTTGWQSSAKTLQPFAFSIGVQASSTFVPTTDLDFNFNEVPFSDNLNIADPLKPILPTALGGSTGTDLIYEVEGQTALGSVNYQERFPAFSGIESPFNAIPSMGLVFGVGLPQDFEVTVRLFPPSNILDVKHNQYGGGVKHRISRYFMKEDSPYNVAVGVFYNFSKFTFNPTEFFEGNNQEILFEDKTFNLEGIFSYDKKFFSLFALLGYYTNNTEFRIDGTYTYEVNEGLLVQEVFSVTNPVSIVQENSNVKFAFGGSLKLSHFTELSIAYHFAEYNTLATSLKININNGDE